MCNIKRDYKPLQTSTQFHCSGTGGNGLSLLSLCSSNSSCRRFPLILSQQSNQSKIRNGVKLMLLIEIGLRLIRFLLWGVRLWELKQKVPYGICVNTDWLARKLKGFVVRKAKTMNASVIKDARANCFCLSLLRTQIHTPIMDERALSNKMNNDRADGHA